MKITDWYDRQKRTPVTPEDQTEDWWCPALRRAVLDRNTMLNYISYHRMFMVIYPGSSEPMYDKDWGISFITGEKYKVRVRYVAKGPAISFCPFCGSQLPDPLSSLLDERLAEEGLLDDFASDHAPPDHYLSNEWWKPDFSNTPGDAPRVPECLSKTEVPHEFSPGIDCRYFSEDREDVWAGTVYNPPWREFGIRIMDIMKGMYEQPLRYDRIRFSPWCGQAYPGSMRTVWRGKLLKFGVDPDGDYLPEQYTSDHWWRHIGPGFNYEYENADPPIEAFCKPPATQISDPIPLDLL